MTKTTNAPSAPASVGVAQPTYMAEKMMSTTMKIGERAGQRRDPLFPGEAATDRRGFVRSQHAHSR